MNSSEKGNLAESKTVTYYLRQGARVLMPFGDGSPYDLVIDSEGQFTRVQVKTGVVSGDVIRFNSSSIARSGVRTGYAGRADVFAVYCMELDTLYLVPVSKVGINGGRLRLFPPKNNQTAKILLASSYKV